MLKWPAYPLPRLDQKVLSRLADCDDVIRGPLFSLSSGSPKPKSATDLLQQVIKFCFDIDL